MGKSKSKNYVVATDVGGTCTDTIVFAPGEPPELGESVFELADHVAAPAGEHGALESIRFRRSVRVCGGVFVSSCAPSLRTGPRATRAT